MVIQVTILLNFNQLNQIHRTYYITEFQYAQWKNNVLGGENQSMYMHSAKETIDKPKAAC